MKMGTVASFPLDEVEVAFWCSLKENDVCG
jgi:hypothetical protein